MSFVKFGYLAEVGAILTAANGSSYCKLVVKHHTGYDMSLIRVNCFLDSSKLDQFVVGDKVRLELKKQNKFYRIISITASDFFDCVICKAPITNAHEAINCEGCMKDPKTLLTGQAELLESELNNYEKSKGLKLTLLNDDKKYYTVVFQNQLYFKEFISCDIGKNFNFEAWVTNGQLIKLFNVY